MATSTTALLNTLSFTETTRIKLREFSGQPPNNTLDQILDNIFLTPKCPFQLSSNVLEYLKSVFIFYDLTAKNLLRSVNYCLLDQYSRGNAYAVCSTTFGQAKKNIDRMKHEDFELIRRLPSFRPYVESMMSRAEYADVIAIFENDEFFRKQLVRLVRNIYTYFSTFYGYIRLLWILVKDLPGSPMGKRLSDIYLYCHSSQKSVTATDEFKNCWQLLSLLSKREFIILLEKCYIGLEEYEEAFCSEFDKTLDAKVVRATHDTFDGTSTQLRQLIDEFARDKANAFRPQTEDTSTEKVFQSRTSFYQNLKQHSEKAISNTMRKILEFLRVDVFEQHLPSQNNAPPLLELFVYSDCDQIRSHLRGTSRSAIHKVLTDPCYYLQV